MHLDQPGEEKNDILLDLLKIYFNHIIIMERPRLDTEPIRINVYPKNKNNKKIKKDGTVLAYKCRFCNYQAFHLESTRAHSL